MINGVEILATQEVAVGFAFNWIALFITFVAVFVVYILFGIIMSKLHNDWNQLLIGVIVGIGFGCIFGIVAGFSIKTPVEYKEQYKVVISDEVPMNDFLEHYEIISQEGKIYTVVKRND